MTESVKKRSASKEPEDHAPKRFRSLLVPVDLTPMSDRVLSRVALLPLADGARITLLHVVPESLPVRARLSAERDAKKALADETRSLAKSLPQGVIIEATVKIGAAAKEIAARAKSTKAELVVMGRGGGRALRDVFLGSTAERVIRRSLLPVLVVRLAPHAPYRRPALALELDQTTHDIVALMLRVIPPPRPRVALIHALEAPYQDLVYPSLSDEEEEDRREEATERASRRLAKLLTASLTRANVHPGDAPTWKHHLRPGSARLVIEKVVKKAETDLLVLGTHGYTGIAHVFLGTVAGDVLREVACDVLVVPQRAPKE